MTASSSNTAVMLCSTCLELGHEWKRCESTCKHCGGKVPFAHPQAMCARNIWAYLSENEVKDLKQEGLEKMEREIKKAEVKLRETEKLHGALIHRLGLTEAGASTPGGGIARELANDYPIAPGNDKISGLTPDPETYKEAVEETADRK